MSSIVEFFVAPDDEAAAGVVESGPDGTFETLTAGNFDAISAIDEWDRVLTGRTAEELERDDVPRVVAGQLPLVIAASAALRDALARAGQDELASATLRWIDEADLAGYDPELFTDILRDVAALAGTATGAGHGLYCWIC